MPALPPSFLVLRAGSFKFERSGIIAYNSRSSTTTSLRPSKVTLRTLRFITSICHPFDISPSTPGASTKNTLSSIMDFDISDDREAEAIASLMDINQLVSKRSSRKGYITRAESFLTSIQHFPPQAVDAIELERKFTELSRLIRLYEKVKMRYEELIDPSEKVPVSE